VTAPAPVRLEAEHLPALRRFLDALPEHDLTFIKEDVANPAIAAGWVAHPGSARRSVVVEDGEVLAFLALLPLPGWSSHVGELRLVVAPGARGRGLGAALARHALQEALDMGLKKVVVEVVAEQEGAVSMFSDLGFRGEALLTCHIRDRSGALRDLLVLAHDADEEWSAMASLGVQDDLGAR
jgi:ribosomal protein S18 acetylase RimI-like enzyme